MDTETGMYYLMSRYYDPVTHRFLNADGYFQTGLGILDANMNAYCKNNPIMNSDSLGNTVYTAGINLFGCFGLVAPVSVYYACDDKGNSGFFYSYCDFNESGGVGIVALSFTATSSVIWDAETVEDLDKNYSNWGFSLGEGLSLGADLICLEGYERPSGVSVSIGAGAGIDLVHAYTTTTKTIWSNNNNTKTKSNNSNNTKKSTSTKLSNNSTITIGRTKYKICPTCGCPHIIIK